MQLLRPTLWVRVSRTLPILGTSIGAFLASPAYAALESWAAFGPGPFNWSDNASWLDSTAPVAGDSTLDVLFPAGAGPTTTTNDFFGLILNALTFQGGLDDTVSISGNDLAMQSDGVTNPALVQNGTAAIFISAPIALTNTLSLTGTGSGLTTLSGALSGADLVVNSGNWRLSNVFNSFNGVTVTGGVLEVDAGAGPIDFGVLGTNSYLGSGELTINGGELKLTTTGNTAGNVIGNTAFGRPFNFGANGGILNLNGMDNTQGLNINLANAPAATAVIKFNGGVQGLNGSFGATVTTWNDDANALRISTLTGATAGTPLRIELTNGAELAMSGALATNINVPLTLRGVAGGDPSATGSEKTTGRVTLPSGPYNFNGGLFIENTLQFQAAGAARTLNGNITLNPGATANFQGRGTGTAIANPEASALRFGSTPNAFTLTISDGAIAGMDLRLRTDQNFSHGIQLFDRTNILPGGTLKFTHSYTSTTAANHVGWVDVSGDITGNGTTANESVIDLRLPAANTTTFSTVNGVTFNSPGATGTDLIVNGAGFGGLKVIAGNRIIRTNIAPAAPAYLYGNDGSADPVTTAAKVNNLLTAGRLAALTGSGGYLTPAPAGNIFSFPVGGEWPGAVNVGLRAVNHNVAGVDVSLGTLTTWGHNLAVDAGATLDLGAANPFTLTAGTLHGSGTVSTTGRLQINSGANLSPGLSNVGTLSVGNLTLNGSLLLDVNGGSGADVLGAVDLTLGGTSSLTINPGSVLSSAIYTIVTYSGTLTGTFFDIATVPPGYSVDYGVPGVVRLVASVGNKIWNGAPGFVWSTNAADANWQGGVSFSNPENATFNDTATGSLNVSISGSVSPALVTFGNVTKNYTVTGSAGNIITGPGSLLKTGAGTVELSGPHDYSGGTTITGGTLKIGASESLPNTGTVSVSSGATLDLNGQIETVGDLVLNGILTAGNLGVTNLTIGSGSNVPANLTLAGSITKTGAASTISGSVNLDGGNRTFNVAASGAPELVISGVLSNGSLTKMGSGTLLLGAVNSLVGTTTVNAGTLRVGVVGAIASGSDVVVTAGGILDLNNLPYVLGTLNNSGITTTGGTLTVSALTGFAPGSVQMNGGLLTIDQAGTSSYGGAITGVGTQVVKQGTGVQTLTGASTYTGGLNIQAGRINASGGAGGSGGVTVNPGTGLQLIGNLTGNVTASGGTVSSAVDMTNAIGGNFTIIGPTAIHLNNEDNTTQTGDFAMTGTLRGSGNLDVSIISNAGADTLDGFRLRGTTASDYSGTITLGPRVKFELQSTSAANFSAMGTGKIVATAGTATGGLNGTYSQVQTRVNTADLVTNFANNVEISGLGVVNFNLLGVANTTSIFGDLRIGDGQSAFFNKNDAGLRTAVFPTVTLTGGNATFSVWDPSFGSNSATNDSVGPSVQLGAIGETMPGSGAIFRSSAAVSATVFPSPHVTITGVSGFTGPTDIQTGVLSVSSSGSLASSSQLALSGFNSKLDVVAFGVDGYTIPAAQKVLGIGDWDGRMVLNGTLAPGLTTGHIATLTGDDLTLDGAGVMQFELSPFDSTGDLLTLIGAFTKGSAGSFVFDFEGGGLNDTTYTLVQFSSTDFAAADFSYIDLGAGLSGTFTLTANELLFTIPEPGSASLFLGGLALLALRRRSRK
jgi:fibronectin-binding autotransporter adhesin